MGNTTHRNPEAALPRKQLELATRLQMAKQVARRQLTGAFVYAIANKLWL